MAHELADVLADKDEETEVGDTTKEVSADKTVTEGAADKAASDGAQKQEEPWTKAAVLDERRKRQALEVEVEQLRRKGSEKDDEEASEPDVSSLMLYQRIALTRELMLETKEDYEEMEQVFVDLVKQNPALREEMLNSTNPARFAYKAAKAHSEMKKLTDPTELEKLKKELEAKIRKELEADKKTFKGLPDLSKATGASGSVDASDEDDLKEIFKKKRT